MKSDYHTKIALKTKIKHQKATNFKKREKRSRKER